MRLRAPRAAFLSLAGALALSGCGGGGGEAKDSPAIEVPEDAASGPGAGASGDLTGGREKPSVEVPAGPTPTELQIVDLEEGTGVSAKAGDQITVHYVGVHFSSGEQFDASWDRGQPFPLPLGLGRVIKGWDQGLVGMKVGGRRQLVIPPDLAYEDRGTQDGTIKPGETLVFVVDLLAIG